MENDEDENEGKNKPLAFQAQQVEKFHHRNKRRHHFHHHEETSESTSQHDDSDEEEMAKEYEHLMKKMEHLMKKGGKSNFKRFLKEKNKLIYLGYGRSGHVKCECFKLKMEQSDRHKGFKANWDGVNSGSNISIQRILHSL